MGSRLSVCFYNITCSRILLLWHNLMFGIIILVWGLLFFFGCFSDVYWMVLVIIIVIHNQRVTQKFRNVYDFSFIRR